MKGAQVRLVEILDRMTCIKALAVKLDSSSCDNPLASAILSASGFTGNEYCLLITLDRQEVACMPEGWGSSRTMRAAHEALYRKLDEPGWERGEPMVIDVEFELGEVDEPRRSDLLCPRTTR